jgi:hypothetical protein
MGGGSAPITALKAGQRGKSTWRAAPSSRFVLQRSRGMLLDREPCE